MVGRGVFGELADEPRAALLWADVGAAVEILVLMTHPDHQRQGLMRELGPEFFKYFTGLKPEIWLEVHALNAPARALYADWGFTQVGERPHYYGPGQSAILMTKALPSL
ncbi:MAG: GNAT family N-acetyltransferase [Bdellovibrionaceae bacterium]|nr:GNAT family N-acetyltransferase [Pseudobdellovibrionaceae bacterium]